MDMHTSLCVVDLFVFYVKVAKENQARACTM